MKILITGASSYVGARIYSDLKDKKFDVIGTYYSNPLFPELRKLDVRDLDETLKLVSEVKPRFIIHAVANPSASWCEKNQAQAVAINQDGTGNIVKAANSLDAKLIYISSFEINNTSTTYGKTKLAGEELVKKTREGYVILRPSLILGFSPNTVNDRPFNRILKNITEKTPALYDTSWKFQPTYLRHISEVISEILNRGITNEIIPISVAELKTRFDVARDILTDFGIKAMGEDTHNNSPVIKDDLKKLKELKLPQYTYPDMISEIKKEIKDYLKKDNIVI